MEIPDGWQASADGKAIERRFQFADFAQAFSFLTRVALHAEKVDHHPDFSVSWNRVEFRLTTHSAGRATERDLALAKVVNDLAAAFGQTAAS